MPEKSYTLILNKYQRDNLLWLINACGWPAGDAVGPFIAANTGDWIGEIGWMLKDEEDQLPVLDDNDQPNRSIEELAILVAKWAQSEEGRRQIAASLKRAEELAAKFRTASVFPLGRGEGG